MKHTSQTNAHLAHLLESILHQRRQSIENARKTNLYSADDLLAFVVWFDEIIELILADPPPEYVRRLIVSEDESGKAIAIDYELFGEGEQLSEAELAKLNGGYL